MTTLHCNPTPHVSVLRSIMHESTERTDLMEAAGNLLLSQNQHKKKEL